MDEHIGTEASGPSNRLDAEHPWPGLAAYDEAAQAFFHGRDGEGAELQRLVSLSPLTVLYGQSGLGKSSLLQAGLFPRLRVAHQLPVYLRLDFSAQAEAAPDEQIAQHLLAEAARSGAEISPRTGGQSLWEWLHHGDFELWSADNHLLMPVLVLDQFEEIFSRGGDDRARLRGHFASLADLIENRIPARLEGDRTRCAALDLLAQRYRVLLSFREDFLPEFEGWKDQLPSLLRNRLRLLPMSRAQAVLAVEQAGAAVLQPGVAAHIVDFVASRDGDEIGREGGGDSVEPVLLSLCCAQLNRRRVPGRPIDKALLASAGQNILDDFYCEALDGLDGRVAVFIETQLIQGDRWRGSYPRDEALARGELHADELARLTDRYRLLRVDQQADTARIELIHDRLVAVVRQARDQRLAAEGEQEERLARERAERLAEDETARRVLAEQAQQRLKRLRNGLLAVMALLLVAVGLAWWQFGQASRSAQEADRLKTLAERAADDARQSALQAAARASEAQAAQVVATTAAEAASAAQAGEMQQRQLARTRELIAFSQQQMDRDTELSLLLAMAALRVAAIPESLARLQEALAGLHILTRYSGRASLTAMMPIDGGRRFALAAADGSVPVWDPAAPGRTTVLRGLPAPVSGVAASPTGDRLFAWSARSDGKAPRSVIAAWDGRTLAPLWRVELGRIDKLQLSPKGTRLLVQNFDTVMLIDAGNGRTLANSVVEILYGAGFAEGGSSFLTVGSWQAPDAPLLSLGGWRVTRWSADDGRSLGVLRDWRSSLGTVNIAPRGLDLLSTSTGRAEHGGGYLNEPVWLLMPEGDAVSQLGSASGSSRSIQFHPEAERTVALASGDVVQEWRIEADGSNRRAVLNSQQAHLAAVSALAYSADGRLLLSTDETDTLRVWRAGREGAPRPVLIHAQGHRIVAARFLADGRILSIGDDGSARLWRVPPGLDPQVKVAPACPGCRSAADWLALAERRRTRVFTDAEQRLYGFDREGLSASAASTSAAAVSGPPVPDVAAISQGAR